MKKYEARFWRGNPQLKNGGYETKRTIEAKTIRSAKKIANEMCGRQVYGTLDLIDIRVVTE